MSERAVIINFESNEYEEAPKICVYSVSAFCQREYQYVCKIVVSKGGHAVINFSAILPFYSIRFSNTNTCCISAKS